MPFNILGLPTELIANVFEGLDYRSILRCREVCRLFDDGIRENAVLQYKLELVKAGQEDGPPSALGATERLQLLRKHQDAWSSLHHSDEKVAPKIAGQVWELYGGVLAHGSGEASLKFQQLPSVIRGVEEREWSIDNIGFEIRDFGIDPAQELLVAIEMPASPTSVFQAHLRTIETGAPHPAAPNPAVLIHQPEGHQVGYNIQVSGDYLGVLVLSADEVKNEIVIWNWKTGACKLHRTGRTLESFAFLSDRCVALGLVNRPLNQAELLDWVVAEEPRLLVVDFQVSAGELVKLVDGDFVCAFHYPTMVNNAVPLGLTLRSDPAPGWSPHPKSQVPFYTSRENRLLVITFTAFSVIDGHTQSLLFVRSSDLLAHINALQSGSNRRIKWREWGPTNTRMMRAPRPDASVWVCYVFGMRFVTCRGRLRNGPKCVEVYDFGRLRGDHRTPPDGDEPNQGGRWVDEETEMREGVFKERIITTLPYWVDMIIPPRGKGQKQFKHVMLSEDTILLLDNADGDSRNIRLLTF